MSLVVVRDVWKSFGNNPVLQGINLSVDAGEVLCLLGSSGSGKTTLLRCINRLEIIDRGSVTVGEDVIQDDNPKGMSDRRAAELRASIGMVFQRFNLFSHLSTLDNVAKAQVVVRRRSREEAYEVARELLRKVGLAEHESKFPSQLSGGQQQRVAIARALAMDPKLMLFDEPTSSLDPELVGEVLEVMKQLAASGMTMIVVTHEMGFARNAGDRVVLMDGGSIVEDSPSEEFFTNPRHRKSRAFLSGSG